MLSKSKFIFSVLIVTSIFVSNNFARAEICAIDNVPAATLLFPYFEVDLKSNCSKSKFDTLLKVTNVSSNPVIAHVTLWSNWSVPVVDFNLNLGAEDVESISLNDIVCTGQIPGLDPVTGIELQHIQTSLSGQQSPLNSKCSSEPTEGNRLVGYATVDVVQQETSLNPAAGQVYQTILAYDNVLTGDFYFVDKAVVGAKKVCGTDSKCIKAFKKSILNARGLHGAPAVHIEAADAMKFAPGDRTFYGRYLNALANDRREPLPVSFHVRHGQTTGKGKLDLIVWREGGVHANAIECGTEPIWYPLLTSELKTFDEDQDSISLSEQVAVPNSENFSSETQIVKDVQPGLQFDSGWLRIDFTDSIQGNPNISNDSGGWIVQRRNGIVDSAGVTALTYPASCN